MPETPTRLILVPTALEMRYLEHCDFGYGTTIELCGFGMVAASICTTRLLDRYCPTEVVLVGIAGGIKREMQVGHAYRFGQVVCHGIGAGSGKDFQTAGELGWKHWTGPPEITDRWALDDIVLENVLLSSASASAGPEDVAQKLRCFPDADAEDMEGFAVAAACRLAQIPLTIVRGISNKAGDRDQQNWQVKTAMQAARAEVMCLLNSDNSS